MGERTEEKSSYNSRHWHPKIAGFNVLHHGSWKSPVTDSDPESAHVRQIVHIVASAREARVGSNVSQT